MFGLVLGVFTRIFSNSFLNVFQKILTNSGEKSSAINFYTYLGLTLIGCLFAQNLVFSNELIIYVLIMGLLGAVGNYYIIKAMSEGELSELAPVNAYKPIVALVFGIIILNELPGIKELYGILLIIIGTFVLFNKRISSSKALLYRFLALLFSGMEAIFIKKVIILSDITSAFVFWVISGLIFSFIFADKHSLRIRIKNINYQVLLILSAFIMQFTTNYIFSKMNVAYALALFQLSAIVSIFLGANIFHEKHIIRKLVSAFIMIFGAILIILN